MRARRPSLPVLGLGGLTAAAVVAAALSVGSDAATGVQERTVTVAKGVVQSTVSGSGSLAPIAQQSLSFGASGKVTHVYVKEGAHVTKGQTLARIDPSAAEVTLAQAKADLESAQDTLDTAESASTSTSTTDTASYDGASTATATAAVLSTATAAASRQVAVADTVADEDVPDAPTTTPTTPTTTPTTPTTTTETTTTPKRTKTTPSKAPAATTTTTPAAAATPSGGGASSGGGSSGGTSSGGGGSSSGGSTSTTSVAAAKAQVASATLSVRNAEDAVAQTKIVAPSAGTVAEINGAVGDTVGSSGTSSSDSGSSSGGTAGGAAAGGSTTATSSTSSSSFITLVDLDGFTMDLSLSESDIGKVKKGQPAIVTVNAATGEEFEAHVTSIAVLSSSSTSTGSSTSATSYPVTVTLDQSSKQLKAGMSASADVIVGQQSGLVVPNQALQGSTVTVVDGDDRTTTRVQTGVAGDSSTIVTSGLTAGEKVLVTSQSATAGAAATGQSGAAGATGQRSGGLAGGGFGGAAAGGTGRFSGGGMPGGVGGPP